MAILTEQSRLQPMSHTLRSTGTDKILAYLSQIAISPPGSDSGEDALSVLNRKLEVSGVVGTGTADPVFANESALFYHNITTDRLFVRGTTDYSEIGSEQSTEKIRVVYSDAVDPNTPNITWNHGTGVFTLHRTMDNWSLTRQVGARWYIVLICPGDSDTIITLNRQRIDGWVSDDIEYTPPSTPGNIPQSVDNVSEALDAFHNKAHETAVDIPTNTDRFDHYLSATDLNVQEALETLNSISAQPTFYTRISWPGVPDGIASDGAEVSRTIQIPRSIQTLNNRDNQTFAATVQYKSAYILGSRTDAGAVVSFTHKIYTNVTSTTPLDTKSISRQEVSASLQTARISIPTDATEIRIGITADTGQGNAKLLITDYDLFIEEGINTTRYTERGRIVDGNARTLQALADQVYDHLPGSIGSTPATAITVNTNQFDSPNDFRRGIRAATDEVAFTVKDPVNVQESLRNIDLRLQSTYNPWYQTAIAEHSLGGTAGEFSMRLATGFVSSINSNPIVIADNIKGFNEALVIRVHFTVSRIESFAYGSVRIIDQAGTTIGDPFMIAGGGGEHYRAFRDEVYFSAGVPAANVSALTSIRIRTELTRGGQTGLAVDRVFITIAPISSLVGVAGLSIPEPEIVWQAGPTLNDRRTTSSTTTLLCFNRSLGTRLRTTDQFRMIAAYYDTDATQETGYISVIPEPLLSQIIEGGHSGRRGLWMLGAPNAYKALKFTSTHEFYIWEGTSTVGLRKIYGIT